MYISLVFGCLFVWPIRIGNSILVSADFSNPNIHPFSRWVRPFRDSSLRCRLLLCRAIYAFAPCPSTSSLFNNFSYVISVKPLFQFGRGSVRVVSQALRRCLTLRHAIFPFASRWSTSFPVQSLLICSLYEIHILISFSPIVGCHLASYRRGLIGRGRPTLNRSWSAFSLSFPSLHSPCSSTGSNKGILLLL